MLFFISSLQLCKMEYSLSHYFSLVHLFCTDLQNPRQVQRPKSCSHLTIKVQSRLMSRSRTPSSVSKPAVAPKPRPLSDSYLHGSRPSLSNGDLAHSDGETDSQCVAVVKEREEEERYKAEETHNGEGREKDIETSDNTLANRVVFAHTTEAFEEDIEELDCHIVPYDDDTESDSDEHIYEEAGFDSDGENFISLDRKTIVTRSRSYSGKVSSFVPETVPEETGPEYQTNDYCTVALDVNGEPLNHLPEHQEVNRLIPSLKPRRFLLYSRSAELSQMSLGSPTDIDQTIKDGGRMKSMDETMSLPCMITSSGSFSQRSHQSSSGVSTPTSMVDIPPPFELVHIAKRPVTKSSPSLLIQHDTTDMPKKKKSSFKRFLALKFRRKTESKGFIDGSVRSSRSSSESSHHGPARVIELDRRSTGSSPQLQTGLLKPQLRSDLPSTLILYSDRQKRKGDPFGRGVSRVESFEERSRRPLMPLPLTKPRSISFPSADTSDYENIPAMSSDYENIQIPGRPIRSFTVTEFFEDPNRATMPSNENDGYVDMNSFPGIDTLISHSPLSGDREGQKTYHTASPPSLSSPLRVFREESQRVVDVILSRRDDFGVFDAYISEYDRSMSLLEESNRNNPAFAAVVKKFECGNSCLICLFVFLPPQMNDMMLYTYPQQDGKYRLKNTLSLSGMKVSKPVLDQVLNCLRIEVSDITIILSASSVGEREDWFHTLSRAIADNAAGLCTFGGPCSEAREKLWMALGEAAPVLVPVSHVMMCMNCTSDFSLTLRRHHCNACGKVVCRSCSRNRYPLKYLKDRVAKVCDHCYAELRKRGSVASCCIFKFSCDSEDLRCISDISLIVLCVSLGAEGSTMSGSLQRRKKSKRKWKRLWFLLKDKVLYTFTSPEDKVASESLPLQGLTVKLPTRPEEGGGSSVFQLYHKKTLYYSFRAEDQNSAHRWVNAIEEATIL
uniref:FYVE, RhoGEF and PH domain containing 5a n=1 Tax=Gadus morhua TaxID=8049 RepID=A0A8C4ZU93_GADMO